MMRNGRVYRLRRLVRLIKDGGFLSLLIGGKVVHRFLVLMPTPTVHCAKNQKTKYKLGGMGLVAAIFAKLIHPTPQAGDGNGKGKGSEGDHSLTSFAKLIHPTPTVCGNYNRKGASKESGDGLATFVKTLHPSPRASGRDNAGDSNSRRSAKSRGVYFGRTLNPEYVEILQGFPLGWTEIS